MSRRQKLESLLAQNPNDPFLAYGLALEILKEGDSAEGIERLKAVIANHPDYQAAYFQLGQTLAEQDQIDEAKTWLQRGIEAANRIGDAHAASEMEGLLLTLD